MTGTESDPPAWEIAQRDLMTMAWAAIQSADPARALEAHLHFRENQIIAGANTVPLDPDARIFLVAAGKAGVPMVEAACKILGPRITRGVAAVPDPPKTLSPNIEFVVAGHPLPSEGSISAGEQVVALLENAHEGDVVIALISGGGSALLEHPKLGLNLRDLQQTNELLIRSGMPIEAINTIRIRLSELKGGGLLSKAAPARCLGFILSDVIGDQLGMVASGPTVHSTTSGEAGLDFLRQYDLQHQLPKTVLAALESEKSMPSPAPAINVLIGNNRTALGAAEEQARELAYFPINLSSILTGEARLVGEKIGILVNSIGSRMQPGDSPVCVILGGETVVTVRGTGSGGRNQELALAACTRLDLTQRIALLAIATDGIDGPTPAAGAMVTSDCLSRARSQGLNPAVYLENNDSYSFFQKLNGTILTGPTQTNVNDLVLCLIHPQACISSLSPKVLPQTS